MELSGLPRSSSSRNQSTTGTSSPFEVDDALTLGRETATRILQEYPTAREEP
jgi:hypothetical protein